LLKVHGAFEQQRANLLQLMGARMDGGMQARMQKAEEVNGMLADVIKEVVSTCPQCKLEVQVRLAEAFSRMNRPEDAAEMRPSDDFIDVDSEEVEEGHHDHEGMMADVIDVNR
jgi:hypothetical protein